MPSLEVDGSLGCEIFDAGRVPVIEISGTAYSVAVVKDDVISLSAANS